MKDALFKIQSKLPMLTAAMDRAKRMYDESRRLATDGKRLEDIHLIRRANAMLMEARKLHAMLRKIASELPDDQAKLIIPLAWAGLTGIFGSTRDAKRKTAFISNQDHITKNLNKHWQINLKLGEGRIFSQKFKNEVEELAKQSVGSFKMVPPSGYIK